MPPRTTKTADAIKLVLRLPKPLHRQLTVEARRRGVSLNTQIVDQLQGYEARTVQSVTDIVQPLIDEAVKVSSETAATKVYEILKARGG